MYEIKYDPIAIDGLVKLAENEPVCYEKSLRFADEVVIHPKNGIGHPKPLKGFNGKVWRRKTSDKHRFVYEIKDEVNMIYVISTYGHYYDK